MALIKIEKIHSSAELPAYATTGAAGADLFACILDENGCFGSTVIAPDTWVLVKTGLKFEIEPGYEVQVRPRSGMALKHGVTVLNAPGTIDADYRGEVGVLLYNAGPRSFVVRHGDRIAQAVLAQAPQAVFKEVDEVDSTARGEGGFGSTGTAALA